MERNGRVEDYLDANSPSFFALEAFYEVFISFIRFHFGVYFDSIILFQILDKETSMCI